MYSQSCSAAQPIISKELLTILCSLWMALPLQVIRPGREPQTLAKGSSSQECPHRMTFSKHEMKRNDGQIYFGSVDFASLDSQ